jgi:tetratricopeptide (TPR) repeat protein
VVGGPIPPAPHEAPRAAGISRRAGNRIELMEAVTQVGLHHLARGELHKARELFEEHVALAQRAGDRFHEASARLNLGETLTYLGELSVAHENLEEAETYCESAPVSSSQSETGYTAFQPWNLRARNYIAPTLLWYLGFPDQARKRSQQVLILAQKADPMLFAFALWHGGMLYAQCGEPQFVKQHMDRLMEVTKQYGLSSSLVASANRLRALALHLSGQFQPAFAITSRGQFTSGTNRTSAGHVGWGTCPSRPGQGST